MAFLVLYFEGQIQHFHNDDSWSPLIFSRKWNFKWFFKRLCWLDGGWYLFLKSWLPLFFRNFHNFQDHVGFQRFFSICLADNLKSLFLKVVLRKKSPFWVDFFLVAFQYFDCGEIFFNKVKIGGKSYLLRKIIFWIFPLFPAQDLVDKKAGNWKKFMLFFALFYLRLVLVDFNLITNIFLHGE